MAISGSSSGCFSKKAANAIGATANRRKTRGRSGDDPRQRRNTLRLPRTLLIQSFRKGHHPHELSNEIVDQSLCCFGFSVDTSDELSSAFRVLFFDAGLCSDLAFLDFSSDAPFPACSAFFCSVS
jgi:hypothetical protein